MRLLFLFPPRLRIFFPTLHTEHLCPSRRMPRCSGTLSPLVQPYPRWMKGRYLAPAFRRFSALAQLRSQATHNPKRGPCAVDAEHAALIDPNSLRNTLDAVRAANRTRLIRKVDEKGTSQPLSLPALLEITPWERSQDAAILEDRVIRYTKSGRDSSSPPTRRPRQLRDKRKLGSSSLEPGGHVPDIDPEWKADRSQRSRFRTPWLWRLDEELRTKAVPSRSRLSAEMEAFDAFCSPSAEEKIIAEEAVKDLQHAVTSGFPNMSVEIMGSRATGVATPLSDIDVNIVSVDETRPDVVEQREEAVKLLRGLSKRIRIDAKDPAVGNSRKLSVSSLIHRARVPILRLYHQRTGLEIQVQYTNDGYNTTEYAKKFMREYPTLKTLFRVLKQALGARGLTDSKFGGIGSYPLLNLIIACLKSHELEGGPQNIADQLIYCLDFCSNIDFLATGIIVEPFELFTRQNKIDGTCLAVGQRPAERGLMYLQDPADPSNNLGISTFRFRDIQATFIALRTALQQDMDKWDQTPQSSLTDRRQWSLLSLLVGESYRIFQLSRVAQVARGQVLL